MQEANGHIYFGSLEAAARFGGRLGLRQQAGLPETEGPAVDSFEDRLEQMADPAPATPKIDLKPELMQWGRCGFIRSH
jgi:hypothetical protein